MATIIDIRTRKPLVLPEPEPQLDVTGMTLTEKLQASLDAIERHTQEQENI